MINHLLLLKPLDGFLSIEWHEASEEKSMSCRKINLWVALAIVSIWANSASALTISFNLYPTGNNNDDVASQFQVYVTERPDNTALFTISNIGSIASTITEVLFYDGALLGINTLIDKDDGVGGDSSVDFTQSKPRHPDSLPQYPAATFSADRDRNVVNGIDLGESLGVLFDLQASYAALEQQLKGGTVFIGLHVQRIGSSGGSDWFISVPPTGNSVPQVPDGGLTVTLLGLGMLGMAGIRRALARP